MFALPPVRLLVFASSVVLLACGDDGGREDEASAGGSNSDPSGISVGTVPTEATGGGGISVGGDDTGMKLDLPAESTDSGFPGNGGDCNGNGMENDYEFPIIWISNAGEGTVSKIDTEAAVEVARYRTGPIAAPDPSRTSVNLRGDVAVANRSGEAGAQVQEGGRAGVGVGEQAAQASRRGQVALEGRGEGRGWEGYQGVAVTRHAGRDHEPRRRPPSMVMRSTSPALW